MIMQNVALNINWVTCYIDRRGNGNILTENNNILQEIIMNANLLPYAKFGKYISKYIISLYRWMYSS